MVLASREAARRMPLKRVRAILCCLIFGACAASAIGCGSTMRDWFYTSRQPGYAPVRDDGASAAVFRNDPRPQQP